MCICCSMLSFRSIARFPPIPLSGWVFGRIIIPILFGSGLLLAGFIISSSS